MTYYDWQCLSRGPSNSPQRETVTCKSQSKKVNQLVHTTETNSNSFHPLSKALLLTSFFHQFFSYFHSPFFKKTINKGISSICRHSFSICTSCLCCHRVSVSMQLNPKTTCRTFAAQVGWGKAAFGNVDTSRCIISTGTAAERGVKGYHSNSFWIQ